MAVEILQVTPWAAPLLAIGLGAGAAALASPLACDWRAQPAKLKRRLLSLKAGLPGPARRAAGGALIALALAGGSLAAFAAQPSAPERLPREAVGVMGSGDQLSLIVAEGDRPRTIKPGQEYSEGWTLQALTHTEATLTKGAESRRIGLNPAGTIVQASLGGSGAVIQAIASDPIQQGVLSQPDSRACEAEYTSKTTAPRSDAEAAAMPSRAQILGQERADFCARALAQVMAAFNLPGGRRALALARGDINEVRSIDGLPPLGPARISTPAARTYTDDVFAPGTFSLIGYGRGGVLADGTFWNYRTPADRQAAIARGEEPPMATEADMAAMTPYLMARSDALIAGRPVPPPTPEYLAAQQAMSDRRNAWLAAYPNTSARAGQ